MPSAAPGKGRVVSVRGSVVDAHFDTGLPSLHTLLKAERDGGIWIEVLAQLDRYRVRGVALNPTEGLAKGDALLNTGRPLMAPVIPASPK